MQSVLLIIFSFIKTMLLRCWNTIYNLTTLPTAASNMQPPDSFFIIAIKVSPRTSIKYVSFKKENTSGLSSSL